MKGHEVFDHFPFNHLSFRVVPTNQAEWRLREPEVFNVPEGPHLMFGMLAADAYPQSGNVCLNSLLVSRINHPNDIQKPPFLLERLWIAPGSTYENEVIERMLSRLRQYSNDLDYECPPVLPWTDGWNSNGFARGLLRAARAPPPLYPMLWFPLFPGWMKPVPIEKFGPQP